MAAGLPTDYLVVLVLPNVLTDEGFVVPALDPCKVRSGKRSAIDILPSCLLSRGLTHTRARLAVVEEAAMSCLEAPIPR